MLVCQLIRKVLHHIMLYFKVDQNMLVCQLFIQVFSAPKAYALSGWLRNTPNCFGNYTSNLSRKGAVLLMLVHARYYFSPKGLLCIRSNSKKEAYC